MIPFCLFFFFLLLCSCIIFFPSHDLKVVWTKNCTVLMLSEPVRQNSKKPKVEVESVTHSAESGPIVVISEALAIFFGTGEREMLKSEVLRRVWEYIKYNQLEVGIHARGSVQFL